MKVETIERILKLHGVPFKIENGKIYADLMHSNKKELEEVIDVTEYSQKELFEFLGY